MASALAAGLSARASIKSIQTCSCPHKANAGIFSLCSFWQTRLETMQTGKATQAGPSGQPAQLGQTSCKNGASVRRKCLFRRNVRAADSPPAATGTASRTAGGEHSEEDAHHMRRCVELARRAVGHTSPNPMVGCVIVKDGEVIGEGFHPRAGEPHAEVFALRAAGKAAEGATAYVSLEPCNHFGRTPPCSQALVQANVKKVVVGLVDPNPLVNSGGIATLLAAGIDVVTGVEEELCRQTNQAFLHRITTGQPLGILWQRNALDGQFSPLPTGPAPPGSAESTLLQEVDVVVVDGCTVTRDGPWLLSAEPNAKQPLRVVLTRDAASLPLDAPILDTSVAPTLVVAVGRGGAENDLAARGVEVVTYEELSLASLNRLFYDRGACSVLWDRQGSLVESSRW